MDPVCVTERGCAHFTDVTLTDEDNNSIYQLIGQSKAMWQASGATWWPKLEPIEVAPSGEVSPGCSKRVYCKTGR